MYSIYIRINGEIQWEWNADSQESAERRCLELIANGYEDAWYEII